MLEIRWHGRGGQGAKTAALMLAEIVFVSGKFATGFPEYGPERMGAPITAYNKISDKPIRDHSNIYDPDIVVVADYTLLSQVSVTDGLKNDGKILINSKPQDRGKIKEEFATLNSKIYTIDANKIAAETIGKNIPNTVLLASVVKISEILEKDDFFKYVEEAFNHKFAKKEEVIKGNIQAIKRGFEEVEKI
ncbi:MAG: 2-oxoacid:acceptor oxidoreductase family protein [Clostridiales Family XIII bacterium]|nr:2-oxoacid:acceptor oxidoreductase family protein [Clostridiales Family XIII bacterium]